MIKAIVTLRRKDGSYPDIGTNNRAVVKSNSHKKIITLAKEFARNRDHRIEFFTESSFRLLDAPYDISYKEKS